MATVQVLKRKVEKLEQMLAPKPEDEIWVVCLWPWDRDEPHGKYGGQKLEMHTRKYEAVSEEDELKILREQYESIPVETRKHTDYWDTWEHFLKYSRCKCGKHGS